MKLILDNNILFSIMNPESVASYLFASIKSEFFAPEFIKLELEKHKEECIVKSKLSEQEFKLRQIEIENYIKFIKLQEYKEFLEKAINSLDDPKDSPYLALALYLNSAIWSNDPHLFNQELIKVFTTVDLVKMSLKSKI